VLHPCEIRASVSALAPNQPLTQACKCVAIADRHARCAHTRALLATLVDRNGPAFHEADANREESEYRRLVDRARGHLAAMNKEPDMLYAHHKLGYRDTLAELMHARPAFQPCLRNARTSLVRPLRRVWHHVEYVSFVGGNLGM
jgi:hypothetical protein